MRLPDCRQPARTVGSRTDEALLCQRVPPACVPGTRRGGTWGDGHRRAAREDLSRRSGPETHSARSRSQAARLRLVVGVEGARPTDEASVQATADRSLILLDTNAALYLITGSRRARPLHRHIGRLRFSPLVLLEMRLLEEAGRVTFAVPDPPDAIRRDSRWIVDTPPLGGIVAAALELGWTRDPFDRLIVGHAISRRFRLATSDETIVRHVPPPATLPL